MEAKRYVDSVQTLTALQSDREDLKLRVERLRRLQSMVDPLKTPSDADEDNNHGGSGVQENLVTRGGVVEKELERMRMLLVRVAGRVGSLPAPSAATAAREAEESESMSTRKKRDLDNFLADSNVFPNT